MKNIEKYKDFVLENFNLCRFKAGLLKAGIEIIPCKDVPCTRCKERCLEWLMEEHKEPILNKAEREYLSAVIKPFRKRMAYISKVAGSDDEEYIHISGTDNIDAYSVYLPNFPRTTMYKGMELNRNYTLEELGL